jgi:hypothetical protein
VITLWTAWLASLLYALALAGNVALHGLERGVAEIDRLHGWTRLKIDGAGSSRTRRSSGHSAMSPP